jgi:hypothetical protein
MIKARTYDKRGRPIYVFALAPENVVRLRGGDPIYFAGHEIGLPGHHFVMLYHGPHVRDHMAEVERIAAPIRANDPRVLCSFGLDDYGLERLGRELYDLDGERFHIDGRIIITIGTEARISSLFGIDAEPVPPGYRDELDPSTGTLKRRRQEDA